MSNVLQFPASLHAFKREFQALKTEREKLNFLRWAAEESAASDDQSLQIAGRHLQRCLALRPDWLMALRPDATD